MGWRCRDAAKAYAEAIARGAEPALVDTGPIELRLPAIRGIGGAILSLIHRYAEALSMYHIDFASENSDYIPPVGSGLQVIDTLTHNVYGGVSARLAPYSTPVA